MGESIKFESKQIVLSEAEGGYKVDTKTFLFSPSYEKRNEYSADEVISAMNSRYDKTQPYSTGVHNGLWLLKQLVQKTKADFVVCFWHSNIKGDYMTIYLKGTSVFEFATGKSSDKHGWRVLGDQILQNAFTIEGDRVSTYQYGSYDKIEEIANKIVYMFNDGFKRAYGQIFTNSFYKNLRQEVADAESIWKAMRPAIEKAYDELWKASRKFNGLELGSPNLNVARKRVELRFNQPRWMRHPNEYGGYEKLLMNQDYEALMSSFDVLHNLLNDAAKKLNMEVVIAASFND
jgi:hypothetical protein